MTAPTTPVLWIDAKDRLPDRKTYGPYPRVLVALGYHDHPAWGFGVQIGELRFINGDEDRPYWVCTDKSLTPLENSARGVVFWADHPAAPAAL